MNDQSSRYAERVVIYALLALAAVLWFGLGGMVFLGILQDAGAA
jgi:small neutral amino acid transporter SnatA (MarC family)